MSKKDSRHSEGFTEEERRLRVRLLEMGIRQKDVANALGITKQDVSMVIRGESKSPRYVAEVYKYLKLKVPEKLA